MKSPTVALELLGVRKACAIWPHRIFPPISFMQSHSRNFIAVVLALSFTHLCEKSLTIDESRIVV
jgi:hypothetical protein